MALLLSDDALRARAAVGDNELASLADGLAAELAPLYRREVYLPREKALLSREGGRCPRDGATLEFDPFSPHEHRCPTCRNVYTGVLHDRFWIFWYQLWLAERAVHGALLANLRGDQGAGALAAAILDKYASEYMNYPNRDNVLGPTRLFFSTYLESIWLLNVCIAVDLLESRSRQAAPLGSRVRERIIEPSAAIIAGYDEGASNRQVWNDAALLAANCLLGRTDRAEMATFGPSGAVYHLEHGVLADGTWYEGENYHLFAHRGLWYCLTMAETLGWSLPAPLMARFQDGFVTPFLTSLPDLTLPSRRDSPYAISLRQPRFAELCELGLARESGDGDPRLRAVLHHLYEDDVPRLDTGRARTTADVERNLPGTRLSRADLGWRSLLFARPRLPVLDGAPLGSVLLDAQGIAVFRRERERIYLALDYGTSGGGHGHPDRLNVLLSDGPTRWLDDMGTGSYVDPSLHWYRSTLAHNAPLFNGCEQLRVDGELFAFDEQEDAGWACARVFDLYPGVAAMRTVVARADYAFDELAWEARRSTVMDLPIHIASAAINVRRFVPDEHLKLYAFDEPLEDVWGLLSTASARWLAAHTVARVVASDGGRVLNGFILSSVNGVLYQVSGPGAPGKDRQPFLVLRVATVGETAWVRTVWDWTGHVETVWVDPVGSATTVERRDGSHDRLWQMANSFRIERVDGEARQQIRLNGHVGGQKRSRPKRTVRTRQALATLLSGVPAAFDLGQMEYRRSEESWDEAGRPSAHVQLLLGPNGLVVDVDIRKEGDLTFVRENAVNPYDNESPDINGDGIQLYVAGTGNSGWVLIPDHGTAKVRSRVIDGWNAPRALDATWRRTSNGYAIRVEISLSPRELAAPELAIGIVINEKPTGRERRRGQLVLGGSPGEFVYLRGDRESPDSLPRFAVRIE